MTNGHGNHVAAPTPRPNNAGPQPAPMPSQSEVVSTKRDLASWWRQFKRGDKKKEEEKEPEEQGIFGVPLQTSIRYANVAISLYNEQGESYIYGYVPIVVAKCGVFLKEKAVEIEGIFRLSGSEKRIKELRNAFNSPDRYGKGLDWSGYTVHDAANILRRYFNQLPEPIIPLEFYERFREPLRGHQAQAVGHIDGQEESHGEFDVERAIRTYQHLITELPPLNRQLLLYILDLLAVFASKSDLNKMTTPNLAAIFQPGILSHPQHDMAPKEYRLSQDVLIFLIEKQDHFLIGMQGTAADEKTVQEVESGPPTPQARTPTRTITGLGRSASNASAGAESLRKFGGVRRNVSVSSRQSANSGVGASPVSGSFSGGMHRSNTLPSKRSPAIGPSRFPKERDPPTPTAAGAAAHPPRTIQEAQRPGPVPVSAVVSPPSSEDTITAPLASDNKVTRSQVSQSSLKPPPQDVLPRQRADQAGSPTTPEHTTSEHGAEKSRSFSSMFARTPPTSDTERKETRRPNKLQKRRVPDNANLSNVSAHSSTQSLTGMMGLQDVPLSPPLHKDPSENPLNDAHARSHTIGTSLKPTMSPSASYRSQSDVEYSEAEPGEDPSVLAEEKEKETKRRWRLSGHRQRHSGDMTKYDKAAVTTPDQSESNLSASGYGGESVASSSGGRGRRSMEQYNPSASSVAWGSGSEVSMPLALGEGTLSKDPEKRGPMAWIQRKINEQKERHDRAKSPPATRQETSVHSLPAAVEHVRGRSVELARSQPSTPRAEGAPYPGYFPQPYVPESNKIPPEGIKEEPQAEAEHTYGTPYATPLAEPAPVQRQQSFHLPPPAQPQPQQQIQQAERSPPQEQLPSPHEQQPSQTIEKEPAQQDSLPSSLPQQQPQPQQQQQPPPPPKYRGSLLDV